MEKEKEGKNVLHKLKRALSLSVDPNEREARILEIVSKALKREGTIITYSKMGDFVYLTNEEEKFIIKVQDTSFTLVLTEASKVLLNVSMPTAISHKLFNIVDGKINEDIERIETEIESESDKVLNNFNEVLSNFSPKENIVEFKENNVGE